ncbi:glycoside hydrolase family 28 protein [Pedobacter sp. LMG 31464]|uniref:Glycoside hydrolase family 28 protein n=2 Tax=Pedobacter planticolens TaxID=2679964 RepID=A0A923ITL2_9SPHI|nr:glycoside hydrolase family 28 protein [Pedobacter planticolens]
MPTKILANVKNTSISLIKEYNINDFGAKGDGKTDDAVAIQKAIDACTTAGGGRVVVPSGKTYLAGPFKLKSYVEFYVALNAKLLANPNEKVYTESAFRANKGEGTLWISANDVKLVTITGGGIIDGNGISFMGAELEDSFELKPFNIVDPRPHLLTIIGGENIRIHNINIRNSAYWTIHLVGCNDVAITDITLLNNLKVRNGDGIDIDHSRNVRITNCYIESGDDAICLKNRREYEEYGPCESITVSNCIMVSRSCAVKIGSENMDKISKAVFTNCIIKASNRGIGIQNRDEGTVEDIVFSNILVESHFFSDVWWGKAEPIYITAYRRANGNNKDANWRFPKGATVGKVGTVKNIYFSNIKCTGESGVYVSAESADKIDGIYFDQVDVQINKTTNISGGVYDRRPSQVEGLVKSNIAAFYFENATNISLRNSSVTWGKNLPVYYTNAINTKNVTGLKLIGFEGTSTSPGKIKAVNQIP